MSESAPKPAEVLGEAEQHLYAAMVALRSAREQLVAGDAPQKLLSLHVANVHRELECGLFELRQLRVRALNGGGAR